MQKHSRAVFSIILALVFIIVMTSAAVANSSEYAILPAERTDLVKRGEEDSNRNRSSRQRKQARRKYYRQQLYHRKMLYR